jgi:hypothetical protein
MLIRERVSPSFGVISKVLGDSFHSGVSNYQPTKRNAGSTIMARPGDLIPGEKSNCYDCRDPIVVSYFDDRWFSERVCDACQAKRNQQVRRDILAIMADPDTWPHKSKSPD